MKIEFAPECGRCHKPITGKGISHWHWKLHIFLCSRCQRRHRKLPAPPLRYEK